MIDWNTVIYEDCMNPKNGLPSLEDQSVDLCLTDPPYNIKFKPDINLNGIANKKMLSYNDKIENYEQWSLNWFNEIKRICKRILFSPGRNNLKMWYRLTDPLDVIMHYKRNGRYGGRLSTFDCFEPYLYYGEKVSKPYFSHNVFDIHVTSQFLRKIQTIHTSPKNFELWFKFIKKIQPTSVIDPFLGSGTTAEVCTKLGIPWLGYELNEAYSVDINKRLQGCKKEPTQGELGKWLT